MKYTDKMPIEFENESWLAESSFLSNRADLNIIGNHNTSSAHGNNVDKVQTFRERCDPVCGKSQYWIINISCEVEKQNAHVDSSYIVPPQAASKIWRYPPTYTAEENSFAVMRCAWYPISRVASGCCSNQRRRSDSAASSPGPIKNPPRQSCTISGTPLTALAITGMPTAIASNRTRGSPSEYVGSTNIRDLRMRAASSTCETCPRKSTRFSRPISWLCFLRAVA